jgi:hypothetical protein
MPQSGSEVLAQTHKRRTVSQKLEGRTYSASVEVKDPFVYYDSYLLNQSAASTILFNNASGAKARSLSNYLYQQLPQGQAFDVYGLRVSYTAFNLVTDVKQLAIMAFLSTTVLQVQINNKVPQYERNLAALFGGAMHIVSAPSATIDSANSTKWTADTVVHFKQKIPLDQSTQWTVNIVKDAAPAASLGDGVAVTTSDILRVETIGRLTAQL